VRSKLPGPGPVPTIETSVLAPIATASPPRARTAQPVPSVTRRLEGSTMAPAASGRPSKPDAEKRETGPDAATTDQAFRFDTEIESSVDPAAAGRSKIVSTDVKVSACAFCPCITRSNEPRTPSVTRPDV
jgi:hypothetical protein